MASRTGRSRPLERDPRRGSSASARGRWADIDTSIIDPFGVLGGPPVLSPAAAGVVRGKDDDRFFAPKATLQWQANTERMIYLSVAQGIKPSGISTVTGGIGAFDPDANRFEAEKVRVYELGAKTDWAERTVRLNGAVFFQDFTDKQVTGQIPDTSGILRSKVFNANAEVWGLEAELTWLATDHLTLAGAYTYLDTRYTDFRQLTTSPGTIAYTGACRLLTFASPTCEVSYTGNELENAPRHAFVGSASYRRTFGNGMEGFIEAGATSAVRLRPDHLLKSAATVAVSASAFGGRWDVVPRRHALDDDTVKSGFNSGGYLADYAVGFAPFTFVLPDSGQYVMPTPRTFGVRISYRFGER